MYLYALTMNLLIHYIELTLQSQQFIFSFEDGWKISKVAESGKMEFSTKAILFFLT